MQDGTCHNLNEGGRLWVLENTHTTKAIAFRLKRLYNGVQQGSFVVNRIAANGGKQALGCSLVNGMTQRWQIHRAAFTE